MADDVLELLIQVKGELADLRKAVDGTRELNDEVKRGNPVHEEGARAAHRHAGGHRELHKLMHEVSHVSPIMGLALRAVFSPLGALIMGVVLAVKMFHKAIEDAKKAAEDLDKISSAVWEAQEQGARAAEQSAEDYAKALGKIEEGYDKIGAKYKHDQEVLKAIIEQHKTLIGLFEKEEMAAAGGDKDKEAAVKSKYESINRTNDLADQQKLQELKKKELFEYNQRLPHLEDISAERQRALEEVQRSASSVAGATKENAGTDREKLFGTYRKAVKESEQWYNLAVGEDGVARPSGEMAANVAKAKQALDHYDQNAKLIADYNKALKDLTDKAAEATKALTEMKQKVRDLGEDVKTGADVLGVHRQTGFKEEHFSTASGAVGTAEEIAARFRAKQKLSGEEDLLMRSVGSVAAGHNVDSGTAAAMLGVASKSAKVQADFTEKLLTAMENMGGRLPGFETRLARVEQMLKSGTRPLQ